MNHNQKEELNTNKQTNKQTQEARSKDRDTDRYIHVLKYRYTKHLIELHFKLISIF